MKSDGGPRPIRFYDATVCASFRRMCIGATRAATVNSHIETMGLARVISLWQEHYEKVSQEGKALLPLGKVYFLAPARE